MYRDRQSGRLRIARHVATMLGVVLGVAVTLPTLLPQRWFCPAAPGIIAAYIIDWIVQPRNGLGDFPFLICLITNAGVYAAILSFVAWKAFHLRAPLESAKETVAECPICGFRCVGPSGSRCEHCGASTAFAHQLGYATHLDCPRCGYDLTGNRAGRCPECGEPF